MAIDKNMSLARMKSFLGEELKEQILLEIAPILHIGQDQGGYFGASRQILCFIDFLGTLYSGYDEKLDKKFKNSKGKIREISTSDQSIKFIKEVMGEKIDPYYKLNGEVLYKMYRHGLVHLYQPKSFLQQDGRALFWLAYKGLRENATVRIGQIEVSGIRHVGKISGPDDKSEYLAISINSLYYDLIQAIDLYLVMLEQDKSLQAKLVSAANAISELEIL